MTRNKVTRKKEILSVSLRPDQVIWIDKNRDWFSLSKWLQEALDGTINQINKMEVKQR